MSYSKFLANFVRMGTFVLSQASYEDYYLKAAKVRRLIKEDFDRVFKEEKIDVILTPTATGNPPEIGKKMVAQQSRQTLNPHQENPVEAYTNDVMTIPANLAGIPAISVPSKTTKLQGIQLMADHFEEKKLLRVARALE